MRREAKDLSLDMYMIPMSTGHEKETFVLTYAVLIVHQIDNFHPQTES